MSNLEKLKELAKAAGGDDWCAFIDVKSKTYAIHTPGDNRCGDVVKWHGFDGQKRAAAKAKFIAGANPAAVTEIIERLEAAEARALAAEGQLNKANEQTEKFERDMYLMMGKAEDAQEKLDALAKQKATAFVSAPRKAKLFYAGENLPVDTKLYTRASPAVPVKLPKINHPAQFDYAEKVIEALKVAGVEVSDE